MVVLVVCLFITVTIHYATELLPKKPNFLFSHHVLLESFLFLIILFQVRENLPLPLWLILGSRIIDILRLQTILVSTGFMVSLKQIATVRNNFWY